MRIMLIVAFLMFTIQPVGAHEGGAIPANVWSHWNMNVLLVISLLLPVHFYVRGAATYSLSGWRTAAFMAGMAALFVALISPLDAMSGSLFSAHMVQHLLLVLAAAPLLALSRPTAPLLRGLPMGWRKTFGRMAQVSALKTLWHTLTRPFTVSLLHVASILLWHIPAWYSAAVSNEALHILEHLSFFGTALLYWWMLRENGEYGVRILSVFIVMMSSGLLGALMTFANAAWYGDHARFVGAWGLTTLEDQQLAGLFMWIPAGVVYVVAAALLLGSWLNTVERRMLERENRLLRETGDA
jgi:putative membrane protein